MKAYQISKDGAPIRPLEIRNSFDQDKSNTHTLTITQNDKLDKEVEAKTASRQIKKNTEDDDQRHRNSIIYFAQTVNATAVL